MTDPLSLLRAGLDEDERIARAAFTNHTPGADRWRVDGMQVWNEATTSTLVVGHTWPREARHIARQCPKVTLDRVEKLRELTEYARWVMSHNDPDCSDAGRLAREVIETLASIYAEPTEAGEPQ